MIDASKGFAEVDRGNRRDMAVVYSPVKPFDSVDQSVFCRVTGMVGIL